MSLGHTHQSTPKQCITTKGDYIRLTRGYISLILERESDVIVVADHLALGVPDPGSLSELRRELSEVGGLTVVSKGFVSASFPDTYDTNYD